MSHLGGELLDLANSWTFWSALFQSSKVFSPRSTKTWNRTCFYGEYIGRIWLLGTWSLFHFMTFDISWHLIFHKRYGIMKFHLNYLVAGRGGEAALVPAHQNFHRNHHHRSPLPLCKRFTVNHFHHCQLLTDKLSWDRGFSKRGKSGLDEIPRKIGLSRFPTSVQPFLKNPALGQGQTPAECQWNPHHCYHQ